MNITIDQLEYDKEVIVNKKQYLAAMSDCAGLVAGREENGELPHNNNCAYLIAKDLKTRYNGNTK